MRTCISAVISALVLSAAIQWAGAEPKANPYGPIIDRNPFGLKPPPPPVVETNQEPATPPPNVKLTGISNLFAKRALLEITEQQAPARPGQPPAPVGTVNRPILAEGEAMHGVEVVAIDLEKSRVRILVGGTESELTFEVPKPSTPPPGAPPMPGRPGQPMASMNPNVPAAAAQPTIITPGNAQSTGGGGVTLYGGGGTATMANSGVTTLGGAAQVPSPLGTESGLRTIPSRTIRTPNNPNPDQPQQQFDPTQQIPADANGAQQNPTYNRRTRQGLQIPQPPLPPNSNPQQPNFQQPQ
ncbi:MAG TPA: hypothetical protein VFC26_11215 [Verrucomicrobiae bacterium]|nr:hypothetical protein [Verrucomicrobiae bacterium]